MSVRDLWHAGEAAAACNGVAVGNWRASGVSIDTRTLRPGDLFIALHGPNHDGHDHIAEAFDKGAAAAVLHKPARGVPPDAPALAVEDTFGALTELGRHARHRSSAQIIAVTGSVGKTGTKEALRLALAGQGRTFASAGNLNNHFGVPLNLARMPLNTEFAILEMGMNHAGEIARLSRVAHPHVAIITNVDAVHVENFATVGDIADAKAEIFDGMNAGGVAILNQDNPHFARLVAHARTAGLGRIWSFGRQPSADAVLLDSQLHPTASSVQASIRGRTLRYPLPQPGRHWVLNSLAVLLAVKAVGADVVAAARALADLEALPGRGARYRIMLDAADKSPPLLLIDETYNASPASMQAGLAVLANTTLARGGRRIAVFGDMLELGEAAPNLHGGLAPSVVETGVDLVYTCGPLMRHLDRALPARLCGGHAKDSQALAAMVTEGLRPGDVVMVKGSLGCAMARVRDAILALDKSVDREVGGPARPFEPVRHFRLVRGGRA